MWRHNVHSSFPWDQRSTSDPLKLKPQMITNSYVGSGKRTGVIFKNKCSFPLSHVSNPLSYSFKEWSHMSEHCFFLVGDFFLMLRQEAKEEKIGSPAVVNGEGSAFVTMLGKFLLSQWSRQYYRDYCSKWHRKVLQCRGEKGKACAIESGATILSSIRALIYKITLKVSLMTFLG